MYNLFYVPCASIKDLTPTLSLDECLREANQENQSYQTKLVRVNWMIHDLKTNDILKPLLVDQDLQVITGDTRLMALGFYPEKTHVSVLVSAKNCPYADSIYIYDKQHLADILGATEEDILTDCDWHKQQLNWIEIAFVNIQDHMHNEDQRRRMIQNYLKVHPDTVFDKMWCQSFIDWSKYDNL